MSTKKTSTQTVQAADPTKQLRNIFESELEFRPQLERQAFDLQKELSPQQAQLAFELFQKFAPQFAGENLDIRTALEPQETALTQTQFDKFLGTAQGALGGPDAENAKKFFQQQILSEQARRGLATSPAGATQAAERLFGQFFLPTRQLESNIALSLLGRQPAIPGGTVQPGIRQLEPGGKVATVGSQLQQLANSFVFDSLLNKQSQAGGGLFGSLLSPISDALIRSVLSSQGRGTTQFGADLSGGGTTTTVITGGGG